MDSVDPATVPADLEDPDLIAFRRAVAAAVPDDVEVIATDSGFELVYRETLTQNGILMRIDSSFRATITCAPESLSFTMEDRGVVSRVSGLGLSAAVRGTRGRINARRTVTSYSTLPDGSIGAEGTQVQDTQVFHAAVRRAAQELGWLELEPASAKIGKFVAIFAVAGLVVGGMTVAVMAMLGKLA